MTGYCIAGLIFVACIAGTLGFTACAVLVPYGDPRVKESKDGRFHVCELPKGQVRCLYVPMRSF